MSRLPLETAGTQLTSFIRFCERQTGRQFSDYAAFEHYCANRYADFWGFFLEWSRILCEGSAAPVVTDERCEFATFFPELRLNYAENLLRIDGDGFEPTRPALTALHRDRPAERWSRGELRAWVSALAAGMVELGLGPGQRVALTANNTAAAVLGCLGAAAIGCSVSSGALDVGAFALISRFSQVEPALLLADLPDPGTAGGRQQRERFVELARALPSLRGVLLLDDWEAPAGLCVPVHRASTLLRRHAGTLARWPRLPFNHPLFILFTSGTTGPPKCLVHGAGGTLLEHVKEHRLHGDLRPSDKLFFHTSTGWMMWNWQLSALAVGAEIVLNDSPVTGADSLWHIAAQERVTAFGTSPAYLRLCDQSAWAPPADTDFSALHSIYSTGSILHPRQQEWVWRRIKHLPIQSISGGTDIVGCFVLGNPNLPVFSTECQCRSLGLDVRALNVDAQGIGELVCGNPFPSRPVALLNDPDGSRFHAAYFAQHPGVWTHGDLVAFTPEGSARMHGRCDGVLNIRGIRIGPAEIYSILEEVPQIAEAMAIEQRGDDEPGNGRLVLLLVLNPGRTLDRELDASIKRELGRRGSPAHVPAVILVVDQLPTTHSGKLSERSARDALNGHAVANSGALRNPECLEPLKAYAAQEPRAAPAPMAGADLQQLVTGVWESVLGLSPIRLADNYFDLGGDSLRALRIMAEIRRLTGCDVSMKLLWDAPTVADLSAALSRQVPAPYQPLVLLEPGADTTPLFIVHGVGGSSMELLPLAQRLRSGRPVYALQGRGLDAGDAPHAHIDDMVHDYLVAVRSIQPHGPYLLAGYSFGGLVAYEMGRRLAAAGQEIALLALLDTSVPERHWSGAAWVEYFFRRLRSGLRGLRDHNLRDWAPRCLGLARALIERLRSRRLSAERLADPPGGGALPEPALRVRRAGFAAALARPPRPSALSLTLFRADLKASHACDPALVWRRLVPTLDVHDVPGTHASMICPPQVDVLAGCLGQCLRELRGLA